MKLTEKKIAVALMIAVGLTLAIIQLLSTGPSGETDSITHYQIARYAFKYPALFFNHWGKPLFTILSSPLAQFGYSGAVTFNLICGLLSGWLAYLICKSLGYRHAWAAVVFTVFMPGYINILYTSLTEIICSLVIIASIYLFVTKKFIWSAVLISLVPFVRTEGVMFIVLFMPALLWMRQYKALPFLLFGFILFGFLGMPVHHDFFWFFTKMPYSTDSSALYGKGSFWVYFDKMDFLLGYPLLIFGIVGLIFNSIIIKKWFTQRDNVGYASIWLLIIPAFFGYIIAQSFMWWKGMGVLASERFMACVLPLGSILAVAGFDGVMEKAKRWGIIYFLFGIYVLFLVVRKPFHYGNLPMKTGMNFAVMEKLTNWLKSSSYNNNKAFYSDPMFPFYMDMDPYNSNHCVQTYSFKNIDPANLLQQGDLLIWDAQFSGFEGHLSFDSLAKNNNMRLLNVFSPVEEFTIIGGQKYKLAVFMKAPRDTTHYEYKQFWFDDYEGKVPEGQSRLVTNEKSFSDSHSIKLDPQNIYGPAKEDKLKNLPGLTNISLRASIKIFNPSDDIGTVNLVMSVEDSQHKQYRYILAKDSETKHKVGEWFTMSLTDVVERNIPADGSYKIYVWYTGKNKIYIDDLKLESKPAGF